MRPYLLPLLAILMVTSAGCVPRPAMDQSEFKGFCYQAGGLRGGDCDNISICNTYLSVIDVPQKSLQACLQGCVDINRTNVYQTLSAQCINVSQAGMDYCQRFCRGAYPEQPRQ